MKIVCTHCQASYQVDLPRIKPGGVEFKCAKCEQKFLVKPQDTEQAEASVSKKQTVAASAPAKKTIETSTENEEETPPKDEYPSQQEQESPADDNLDNLMDDLLNEDLTLEPKTSFETEENQKAESDATTSSEGADDLDGLFDDLITDDTSADKGQDYTVADTTPTEDTMEGADDLDGLFDDLITDDTAADKDQDKATPES
ncbi:MAG: hypothetical protein HOD90_08285, partial [Nitrospina sp.]|nr:hypothetical protein [Nitrospina sp.]